MALNPFDSQLQDAEQEMAAKDAALREVKQRIEWFEGTNLASLHGQWDSLRSEAAGLLDDSSRIRIDLLQLKNEIRVLGESIRPLWNPLNWLDAQQRAHRANHRRLRQSRTTAEERLRAVDSRLEVVRHLQRDKQAEIERYMEFDLRATAEELSAMEGRLLQQKGRVAAIYSQKMQVDAALEPILSQIREIDRQESEAVRALDRARRLESELSYALNSYEKAMTHQECEREFGTGSPRQVMHRLETDIRRLDRNREKLQARAGNVAKKAAREIGRLVVDGSNLCYEGEEFIGLAALRAVVPIIAGPYDVVVVFDASITEALGSSEASVRDALGRKAKVHVVAPGADADETILDLAGSDNTTFIVSNDRFAEFREKSAVKDGRLIHHEIVAGWVMIHDLDVSEPYERQQAV